MNWTETRDALIAAGIAAEKMPQEWQWRIDLTGANLGGANLGGANLGGAYLGGANLSRANLGGAYLSRAYLTGAYLGGANLSRANLGGANLREAYLGGANLSRAYLGGANLREAYLGGATINWTSHDLVAEILRQAAMNMWRRRALAGLILVSRDWCWGEFLALEHPEQEWALDVLRGYVREGDSAPEALRAPEATND